MKNLVIFLISSLTALTMSCTSVYDVSVSYDYDKQTNFAGLQTYDWLAVPKEAEIDPLLQDRIKNAVNTELETKGLRMTSDDPDFLIAMQIMSKEGVSYAPTGRRYAKSSRRFVRYGPSYYPEYTYEEGTLVLDFVDSASKNSIWRGTAKDVVQSNITQEELDSIVSEAVQKTLKNFPPPSSK